MYLRTQVVLSNWFTKMYKQLIKRKLAYLMQNETSIINSPAKPLSFKRFDNQKEKEIIVWMRQQEGLADCSGQAQYQDYTG